MNETDRPRISKKALIGIAIYAVLFFSVILISNIEEVKRWIATINTILTPIATGLVIAYLANPFFKLFERKLLLHVRPYQLRRFLALVLTYLLLLLIVGGLLLLIVPQLLSSFQTFSQNFNTNLEGGLIGINNFIDRLNRSLPERANGEALIPNLNMENVQTGILAAWNYVQQYVKEHLRPENIGALTNLISKTGVLLANVLLGIFISIYLLASKEKRYAQIMKFRHAYFGDALNARITRFCTIADKSFGGFLRGKLLDSTIVGFLVYLSCLIFRIPYPILVAVIIAITDIVPVIGPFIGVIPTAIIILLTDPIKVIFFLVAILVIQQIDGNIIAPKILGENTGVSSLCVMIAILVMGDLLGLLGMIIGVPLFATVIELCNIFLNNRLKKKGLLEETDVSAPSNEVDNAEKESCEISPAPSGTPLRKSEQDRLKAYALAKKHRLFDNASDEALDAFARECTEQSSGETPIGADPLEPTAQDGQSEAEIPADADTNEVEGGNAQ